MKKEQRKNKFKEGDIVFEITRPQELMLITRRKDFVYFCRPENSDKGHESAFMERDLREIPTIKVIKEK